MGHPGEGSAVAAETVRSFCRREKVVQRFCFCLLPCNESGGSVGALRCRALWNNACCNLDRQQTGCQIPPLGSLSQRLPNMFLGLYSWRSGRRPTADLCCCSLCTSFEMLFLLLELQLEAKAPTSWCVFTSTLQTFFWEQLLLRLLGAYCVILVTAVEMVFNANCSSCCPLLVMLMTTN